MDIITFPIVYYLFV